MYKVFYNPTTLEIKGHSDGEVTMDFPYIETKNLIALFDNWKIKIIKNKPTLVPVKGQYTDKEWGKIINS